MNDAKMRILERVASGRMSAGDASAALAKLVRPGSTKASRDRAYRELYNRAHQAGLAAGNAHKPTPMGVVQHANPFDDNSPVVQSWVVEGGVCGFAWVHVPNGRSSFARWLVKQDYAHKSYRGGVDVWVSGFGQSMERKEAYARAFALVLQEGGIRAYMMSRMD